MILRRYFHKKKLDVVGLRAIRDIMQTRNLLTQHNLYTVRYDLYYPSEHYVLDTITQVEDVSKENGEPAWISYYLQYKTNREYISFKIDAHNEPHLVIEVNQKTKPFGLVDAVESVLQLERIESVPSDGRIDTAFVAHSFDENGTHCATELTRFLELIGIKTFTGRAFSPKSISEKVQGRLSKHDIVFAILTSTKDTTWLNQEMTAAVTLDKPLFILRQEGAIYKEGILGDIEHIPFSEGHVTKTFIPILEGINELRGGKSHYG